ncbi:hypothetical protein ScPMuIL_015795 [Solemya velum]
MAAIDRFEFLFKEITTVFTSIKDTFAIVGVLYTSRKALCVTARVICTIHTHAFSKLSSGRELRKKFGPWAVVTGSSEGIGQAYAKELAKRGLNIVLVSKGKQRLHRAAKEIEEEYHVQTCAVLVDFCSEREVYDKIWEAIEDKEIGILVNNVGVMYDYPDFFLEVPVERLWQIINVNVAAATIMTHMILPQMVKRGRGAVVMVSTGTCTQITPQMTIYAASKSFLDYFAKALQYEYKDKGIIVQSLRPLYVATRMTEYSKTLSSTSMWIPSASLYAKHAVTTLGYSSRTTGYWPHGLLSWVVEMIPEWLWMWGSGRLNSAFRRQASDRVRRKSLVLSRSQDSFDTLQDSVE